MSEEQVQTNEVEIVEDTGISLEEFNSLKANLEKLEAEKENYKKLAQGQDKKNSELFKRVEELQKEVEKKEKSKMSVEEQIQSLQNELKRRDEEQIRKDKEALVLREIASNGLDPEMDFDFIFRGEDAEEIQERIQARTQYYDRIKSEALQSMANGSIPKSGKSKPIDKLEGKTLDELLVISSDPDLSSEDRQRVLKMISEEQIKKQY